MEISKYIRIGAINAINNIDVKDIIIDSSEYLVKLKDDYDSVLVKKYILNRTSCEEKRLIDSMKLVNIDDNVLNKKINILSTSECLKIELAILLIQKVDCIILDNFDKYFMEKELMFFKKLFKKLANKYHKTIVFVNCNLVFMFELIDRIVVKESKKRYITFDNPSFYDENILSLFQKPKIVEFVKYLNLNNKNIKEYIDIKELMKAIFREV